MTSPVVTITVTAFVVQVSVAPLVITNVPILENGVPQKVVWIKML
jgi:hypothetical protein